MTAAYTTSQDVGNADHLKQDLCLCERREVNSQDKNHRRRVLRSQQWGRHANMHMQGTVECRLMCQQQHVASKPLPSTAEVEPYQLTEHLIFVERWRRWRCRRWHTSCCFRCRYCFCGSFLTYHPLPWLCEGFRHLDVNWKLYRFEPMQLSSNFTCQLDNFFQT